MEEANAYYRLHIAVQKRTCFTGTKVQILTQLEVQSRRTEAVRGERGGLEGSRDAVTKEQTEFMVTLFFGPMKTQERMKEKVLGVLSLLALLALLVHKSTVTDAHVYNWCSCTSILLLTLGAPGL